ncbi:MAG: cell surface protein [Candidatus Aphodosoma sp.]
MKKACILIAVAVCLSACRESIPMVSLGIDDVYNICRMQKLGLHPAFTGEKYRWQVNGTIAGCERDYIFLAQEEGIYSLVLDIIDPAHPFHFEFTVNVFHEEIEYSPYISKVYEYCPAPGQFINEMPQYEPGNTYADMLQKAEDCISGTNDIMISLGGYGGYVTFGFDHTIINVPGEYDFRIWGNAFYELTDPDAKGGSAEPGIVMVSYDTNCNGIPDDEWYELAGSEYYKPTTLHNYSICYRRPDAAHIPAESDDGYISDLTYIPWSDSRDSTGYIAKNIFHSQSYWPLWTNTDTLTFTGSLLPPNGIDLSGSGRYYVLYAYEWGYADNHPNDFGELNSFKIDWAVDRHGHPANLPGIDFVRVYTGINQYCGWIGESSTEINRARDLHIKLPGEVMPDSL